MNLLHPFTTDLIQAFGWTLLHSFWQGCCVFLCLRIVLWLWPQAGPSIKYHLSFLSLTGIAGWFAATFAAQLRSAREAAEIVLVNTSGISSVSSPITIVNAPAQTEGLKAALPGMEAYFPLLVCIYVVGVTVMLIRLCIDLAQLKTLRKQGLISLGSVWEEHLVVLARKMGISKRVGLHISKHLQVPVMIGFLRPVILLPAAMVNNMSPEQLEAILLHELAHIKRNDYLLNIFQSIVETLLFFNPFVWWISRNIRLEREHCCDDLVIAGTVQPMHYAKALVALEEYRLTVNPMAMAAAHDRHHLFHRIKRIMEMKTKHLNYSQRLLALLIILSGLVSIAWLNPDSRRSRKENKADTVAPKAETGKTAQPSPSAQPDVPDFIIAPTPPAAPAPAAMPKAPEAPAAPDCNVPCPEPPVTAEGFPAPPVPPLPPLAPATPRGPMAPLPPAPPAPPVAPLTPGVVYNFSNRNSYFYSDGDTTVPGGRIIIRDKDGKAKTYNSIDDMSPAERKEFEESYLKYQKVFDNKNFNFDHSFKYTFDSSFQFKDIDFRKVQLQALEQLENMDLSQLQFDLNKLGVMKYEMLSDDVKMHIKKADWDKAMKETRKNLQKIDWKKQQQEIRKMNEKLRKDAEKYRTDAEKFHKDEARFRVDADKFKVTEEKWRMETERAHNAAMARADVVRKHSDKLTAEQIARVKQQEARIQEMSRKHEARAREMEVKHRNLTERNKATTENYNKLLKQMESDKLIDRNEGFHIEKKGNDLFINGKKQSNDVRSKYEQYLENDNVTIRGKQTDLHIHAQNNN